MKSITDTLKMRTASPLLSGLFWSCLWLAAGVLLLSLLLAFSSVSENNMGTWVLGIHALAALAGGFVAARRSGRKGWYFGFSSGMLYTALILLISFLATDAKWTWEVLLVWLAAVLAGSIGGMIGVSTAHR